MSRNASKTSNRSSSSPSRTSATVHVSAHTGSPRGDDAQPLLTPVVRSKRTPIACTECRRRQVKCTGATPQCERCEKRGVKCEYIPCSQQRASSSGSPTPPAMPERQLHHPGPYYGPLSSHNGTTSWQQTGSSYESYFPSGRTSLEQQGDWPTQAYSSIASDSQLPQQYFSGVPAHPRVIEASSAANEYDQATLSYHTYGQPSLQPVVPSHPGYVGGTFPSGFVTTDAHLVSGDQSLSYGYGQEHGRASFQAQIPSHRSSYPGQYLQGGNSMYGAIAGGVAAEFTNQEWTPNTSFMNHHSTPYRSS